jgi:hypothetical protein
MKNHRQYKRAGFFEAIDARRLLASLEREGIDFQMEVDTASGGFGQPVTVFLHVHDWDRGCEILGVEPHMDEPAPDIVAEEWVQQATSDPVSSCLTLDICGERRIAEPTPADILQALEDLDVRAPANYVILERDPMTYIQASGDPDIGFILEYQAGSLDQHYQSVRGDLTLQTIFETFSSYLRGKGDWREFAAYERIALLNDRARPEPDSPALRVHAAGKANFFPLGKVIFILLLWAGAMLIATWFFKQ